jgi:hypothetical protein
MTFMEKLIGIILLGIVITMIIFVYLNLDTFADLIIPVPDKIINYLKVNPFK